MKKIFGLTSIVLFAAAVLMTSCNNEKEQVFGLEMEEFNGVGKTTMGTSNSTSWTVGDPIMVNDVSATVQSGATVSLSTPVQAVGGMFYSFYAGRASNVSFDAENTSYSYTLPTAYQYSANELKAPMAGLCPAEERVIRFANICTMLRLEFVVIPTEVTITSENTAITGEFTAAYNGTDWVVTAPEATSSNNTLTISNPNWASVMYVPLPAGNHKLTITGKTFTRAMSSAQNMQKSTFYPIKCAHAFSVSGSQKVFFSPGNFEYYNRSDYGSIANWGGNQGLNSNSDANDCARFSPNQWDRKLSANRQEGKYGLVTRAVPATNAWLDIFGWGTGFIPGYNRADATGTGSIIGYDEFFDWGTHYGTRLNNNSHCVGNWFTLNRTQWEYLLNLTSNNTRNGKCRIGSVNGVNGLIIAPDDYSGTLPQTINSSTWTSNYQKKGVVFLPAGGHMNYLANVNHSWGFNQEINGYWTSTPVTSGTFAYRNAYFVSLPNSTSGNPSISTESMCRTALNNGNRPGKISVRLVQYAN